MAIKTDRCGEMSIRMDECGYIMLNIGIRQLPQPARTTQYSLRQNLAPKSVSVCWPVLRCSQNTWSMRQMSKIPPPRKILELPPDSSFTSQKTKISPCIFAAPTYSTTLKHAFPQCSFALPTKTGSTFQKRLYSPCIIFDSWGLQTGGRTDGQTDKKGGVKFGEGEGETQTAGPVPSLRWGLVWVRWVPYQRRHTELPVPRHPRALSSRFDVPSATRTIRFLSYCIRFRSCCIHLLSCCIRFLSCCIRFPSCCIRVRSCIRVVHSYDE